MEPDELIGLSLLEAARLLDEAGCPWRAVQYHSPRPVAEADSERVVRARRKPDGTIELLFCAFRTVIPRE